MQTFMLPAVHEYIRSRKCNFMLESSHERVVLLRAGIDGKTIEHLYIKLNNIKIMGYNPRKLNCWEFIGCGRELGGDNADESGVCKVLLDTEADGMNGGKNGGRICWAVSGTFSGDGICGIFAKKLLSCRSCSFFKKVKVEEGNNFSLFKRKIKGSMADAACII